MHSFTDCFHHFLRHFIRDFLPFFRWIKLQRFVKPIKNLYNFILKKYMYSYECNLKQQIDNYSILTWNNLYCFSSMSSRRFWVRRRYPVTCFGLIDMFLQGVDLANESTDISFSCWDHREGWECWNCWALRLRTSSTSVLTTLLKASMSIKWKFWVILLIIIFF